MDEAYHADIFVTCSSYEHMLVVLENGVCRFLHCKQSHDEPYVHVCQLGYAFVRESCNFQEDLNMPQNITDTF